MDTSTLEYGLPLLLAAMVAPFLGSFLGVLAFRMPRGMSIVAPRSRCDSCGTPLTVIDLIPVLSWVCLRGRCRHCGAAIDALYPAMELAAVGIALWAYTIFDGWLFWASCGLGWVLLALAAMDLRHMILADWLVIPLGLAGIAVGFAVAIQPLDHVIGALAGFIVFFTVAIGYRRLRRRDGLGHGDVKLFAAAGAWVTWLGLPTVVLWAVFSAFLTLAVLMVAGRRLDPSQPFPFGPHLCLGLWLTWLYGPLQLV
jgi:leader peptidase (prepilin peptidase) / N-methyltransferase